MKRKRISLILILALVCGLVVFSVFFVTSEAVPEDAFDKVARGMTEAEVRKLLGDPHSVRHDAPDQRVFFYGGFPRLRWCSMEVFFDEQGRVVSKFHDH